MDPVVLAEESKKYFSEMPIIELFEAHGMDTWDMISPTGETLPHVVARAVEDRRDRFRFLTGKCADPRNWDGRDRDRFRLLMGRGVDPLKEDGRHQYALDVAAIGKKDGILGLFRRDGAGAPGGRG